jgi:hypothetical protein
VEELRDVTGLPKGEGARPGGEAEGPHRERVKGIWGKRTQNDKR